MANLFNGDFYGDGKTVIAIYRPFTCATFVINSATDAQRTIASGGLPTDQPVK